jgi:2-polyprenyl-3-methyl-5-hydroxy-6-metoxy-1,4-benzoquinol methylase
MADDQWFDQKLTTTDVQQFDQKLTTFDQMLTTTVEQCFDQMLTMTTEMFFDMEQELFLQQLDARKPLAVLDVGCGNGEYLARLSRRYPQWRCTGLEREERIYHYAKKKETSRLSFHLSSYEQFEAAEAYDCVIVRLTAAHLEDRAHFMRWLCERTLPGSIVVIIDVDDGLSQSAAESSGLPLFGALYREMRRPLRASKLMQLHESLAHEARYAGLRPKEVVRYGLGSETPESKALIHTYMRLVAASRFGVPLPPEQENELKRWYQDPRGMFEIRMFGLMLEV